MPLTDTAIKAFKPKDKPYREFDGGGLYLEITTTGGKLWRLKYRFGGKEKRLSFGIYPTVGLKEARERREDAKKLLAQGVDPGEQKKETKAAAVAAEREQAATFEAVAREWYGKKKAAWSPGHQRKILTRLEKYLFPYLGAKLFPSLEPSDFLTAIRDVESRGAIETAHRLAQLAGQVSRYARIAGYSRYDAAARLSEAITPVITQHYAAITDPVEAGHLLRAIDAYQGDVSILCALRILPYVFVRSGELRAAEWKEINLDASEWVVPAGRMKMRRPHVVPLAHQVVKMLTSLREYSGDGRLVFPSPFSVTRCISDVGLLNALRRMGYDKSTMTIHGFRSMASTLLNERGYRADVIERQLAHVERNHIRASYNFAEYLPERRRMMQEWANCLDGLRGQSGGSL